MSDAIVIHLPGDPATKARPRFGNGRTYTDGKTRRTEASLAWIAKQAMAGRAPLEGALHVTVTAVRAMPAAWSKRKVALAMIGDIRPTTRPDIDNHFKLVDGLNGIVWKDDGQITDVTARKRYGLEPGLTIEVRAL